MNDKKSKLSKPKTDIGSGGSGHISQAHNYGSIWEHLLYGVGIVVVAVGPLLLPGLTIKGWVTGFFGGVVVIYIILCLLGAWKSLKGYGRVQGRARR